MFSGASLTPDGCCFALSDPVEGCEVQVTDRRPDRPKLLSPRFAHMFDAAAYRTLKRDKFRMRMYHAVAARAVPSAPEHGATSITDHRADRYFARNSRCATPTGIPRVLTLASRSFSSLCKAGARRGVDAGSAGLPPQARRKVF